MEETLVVESIFSERKRAKYEIKTEIISGLNGFTRHHIRLDENMQEPFYYREHFDIMRRASKGDEIIFYISSYGGYLDTAIKFVYAMLQTKAHTKAIIYTAASAATLIGFAADEVVCMPLGTVMLHNFSIQAPGGKGQELRDKQAFDDKQFQAICSLLYVGILTTDEIKRLQEDKDFWMLGMECTERLEDNNWEPVRKRLDFKDWHDKI